MSPAITPEQLASRVSAGDRASLARAITLIESRNESDQETGYEVLRLLMPRTGRSHRIAVSGPPGVGKSTLIDAYGLRLVEEGHRVAVLAIDPSSTLSGGSILGDKSRMSKLAQVDGAFIRPSPADLTPGGVTRRTREAMFLCEAAGFDRVLIETVGVGQSETRVAGMVDTFLLLVQPGAGDELQGIKMGIVELADVLAVTKSDGDTEGLSRKAATETSAALRYRRRGPSAWKPAVVSISSLDGNGLPELDRLLEEHFSATSQSGELAAGREADLEAWLRQLTDEAILRRLRARDDLDSRMASAIAEVVDGTASAYRTALDLAEPPVQ